MFCMYTDALRYEEFNETVYNNIRLCSRDQNKKTDLPEHNHSSEIEEAEPWRQMVCRMGDWLTNDRLQNDHVPEATHDCHACAALPVRVPHRVADVYQPVRCHGNDL